MRPCRVVEGLILFQQPVDVQCAQGYHVIEQFLGQSAVEPLDHTVLPGAWLTTIILAGQGNCRQPLNNLLLLTYLQKTPDRLSFECGKKHTALQVALD